MAKWEKTGVRVSGKDGEKTITYKARGIDAWIESRKKAVPHANGFGYWMHTTYYLVRPDGSEREYQKLADAQAAAEVDVHA